MKRKLVFSLIYLLFGFIICDSQESKELKQRENDTTKITFKLFSGYSFHKTVYNNIAGGMDLKYANGFTLGFLLSIVENLELDGSFSYYKFKVHNYKPNISYRLFGVPFCLSLRYTFYQENISPHIGIGVSSNTFLFSVEEPMSYFKSDHPQDYHSIIFPVGCLYKLNNDFDLDFNLKFSFISSNFIMDAIKTDIGIIYKF
jgi:hypothetical protein